MPSTHKKRRKGITINENRLKWQKELQDLCRKCPKNGVCGTCSIFRDAEKKERLLAIKKK